MDTVRIAGGAALVLAGLVLSIPSIRSAAASLGLSGSGAARAAKLVFALLAGMLGGVLVFAVQAPLQRRWAEAAAVRAEEAAGAREVSAALEEAGLPQYRERLLAHGIDRLRFLAAAAPDQGAAAGVPPAHWRRIERVARARYAEGRGRGRARR
eukprot:TRINITY_DN36540_c0_g1_i1.p3 TRINITY_DN36540_c0_g1~~TRINITY_DN36540_c0_g1_i1.p3  ORF type:complete len:154 (+),score=42.76 TRINITY_DN36540_c0_g1_i1:75-536(+)